MKFFLRNILSRSKYRLTASIAFIFFIIYAIFILLLPEADVLSSASILSEQVIIEVTDGQKASFSVYRMRASARSTPLANQCIDGLFTP